MDLGKLEHDASILAASIDADSSPEYVAEVLDSFTRAKQVIAEAERNAKAETVTYIQEHGEITIGDVRYYVGPVTRTKCRDNRRAAEAVLDAVGGDLELFAEHLSAGALKHGRCKATLADQYDQHFETVVEPDLKTGKPKREVKKIDTNYLPKGKHHG